MKIQREVVADLPDYPKGHSFYVLTKTVE